MDDQLTLFLFFNTTGKLLFFKEQVKRRKREAHGLQYSNKPDYEFSEITNSSKMSHGMYISYRRFPKFCINLGKSDLQETKYISRSFEIQKIK